MPKPTDEPTDTDAATRDAQTPDGGLRQDESGLDPEERRGLPGLGMNPGDVDPEARQTASDDGTLPQETGTDAGDPRGLSTNPGEQTLPGSTPQASGDIGTTSRQTRPEAERAPVDPAHGIIAAEARDEPIEAERHPDHAHDHQDHHDDDGGSFASRALWALVLLLVGVGLGLWAAPRLVPFLPAGMAPVAAWLSPADTGSDARLAELEARLSASDARIGELAARADVDPRVEALVTEAGTRLEAEIAELRTLVEERAGGGDETAVRQRLDRLEATAEGRAAELQSLTEQLSGTSLTSSQQSEEAVAQIDVYRAELEGLRAEVGTLSDDVSALGARIDEVAASAEQRVAAAEAQATEAETRAAESEDQASAARDSAAQQTSLAQIRAALTSGASFSNALYSLGSVPGGLSAVAVSGVVPVPQLRDRFPEAAHRAIRAAAAASAEGESLASRARAFIGAQFASRSLNPQTGDAPDAILSRMEAALARGDLDAALSDAEALPPEAREALGDWLRDAERRAEAEEALEILTADLSATN